MVGLLEIVGGAMEGGGKVVQEQGRAAREAALKRMEEEQRNQYAKEGDERKHKYSLEEEGVRATNQQANTTLSYDLAGKNDEASDNRGHTARMGEIGAGAAATRGNEKYRH